MPHGILNSHTTRNNYRESMSISEQIWQQWQCTFYPASLVGNTRLLSTERDEVTKSVLLMREPSWSCWLWTQQLCLTDITPLWLESFHHETGIINSNYVKPLHRVSLACLILCSTRSQEEQNNWNKIHHHQAIMGKFWLLWGLPGKTQLGRLLVFIMTIIMMTLPLISDSPSLTWRWD